MVILGKRKRRSITYKDWITADGLLKLEAWARDGLTDEQIAHNIGIARGTLYTWKKKYKDIDYSLKRGKEVADIEVENALYKRALGYEYKEEKKIVETDAKGREITRQETTLKQALPDVTAQIFWLKNRKPDIWRNRTDIEHSGSIDTNKLDSILDQLKD